MFIVEAPPSNHPSSVGAAWCFAGLHAVHRHDAAPNGAWMVLHGAGYYKHGAPLELAGVLSPQTTSFPRPRPDPPLPLN